MGKVVAIIPARRGSKGIRNKNIAPFCGKPLLAWSIMQARAAKSIDSVWVSSDSDEILAVAAAYGAIPISRPDEISGDTAPSESVWQHALDEIERSGEKVELVVGVQATSPVREVADLDAAIRKLRHDQLDSLLTVTEIQDFFSWRIAPSGPEPVNYDYQARKPRQAHEKKYLENGSFYLVRPEILRGSNNRLGGKIGIYVMERHKMFQIDAPEDIAFCECIMRGYGMDKL